MATLVLPKDTEFNDGNVARGTDVRANDQAIRDFINTAQIDSGNINLSANYTQLGIWTFVGGNLRIDASGGTGILSLDYAPSSTARTLEFPDNQGNMNALTAQEGQLGLYGLAFAQGADSSQLKITSSNGTALSASNYGFVRIRSSTNGTHRTFKMTADVTLDLTGCHWGLDGNGDVTNARLRVYAIDDNGTLRWGVGYQGGFTYIRNTQDDTTATNINLPEEIFTDGNVATDNSPMRDVGWLLASFTDSSNEWAISQYHPNSSLDGIWQPWSTALGGFSANPTVGYRRWMQIGQTVFVEEVSTANGTSNATTYTMTLPVKAQQTSPTATATLGAQAGVVVDNGVVLAQDGPPGYALTSGSTTLNLYRRADGTAWSAVNGKRTIFKLSYEALQP